MVMIDVLHATSRRRIPESVQGLRVMANFPPFYTFMNTIRW